MFFTDASKNSYSGILHQEERSHHLGAEVILMPIVYFSGSFGRTQQLWNTERVLHSLQVHSQFAFYLAGTQSTLYCDRKPLAPFLTTGMSSPMLDRWVLELQQFDIKFQHIQCICRCHIQTENTGSVSGQWQPRCTIINWRCCQKHHQRSPFCRHSPKEINL